MGCQRRYSEFVELRSKLTHGVHGGRELHDIVKEMELPPTTLFDMSHDNQFLQDRQDGLMEFIVSMLQRVSAKHLVTADMLTFLGIDDDDPNSPYNLAKADS